MVESSLWTKFYNFHLISSIFTWVGFLHITYIFSYFPRNILEIKKKKYFTLSPERLKEPLGSGSEGTSIELAILRSQGCIRIYRKFQFLNKKLKKSFSFHKNVPNTGS